MVRIVVHRRYLYVGARDGMSAGSEREREKHVTSASGKREFCNHRRYNQSRVEQQQ